MKHLLMCLCLISLGYGYNILCVFPLPSRSQDVLGRAFVETLLNSGHQVTWLTPFPELLGENRPKSLKVIDVSASRQYVTAADLMYRSKANGPSVLKAYSTNVTKEIFANQEFKDIFTTVQFDAVVTDAFFPDVHAGFAAVQQVPWILFSATSITPELQAQVDEVRSVASIPISNVGNIPMSFWERLLNTFRYIAIVLNGWLDRTPRKHLYKGLFDPLAKARGVDLPPLEDSFYNVSILFVNSHESLGPAFSTPPNVVNIAGFHLPENVPELSQDIQVLLDSSPQGVVYFSIGSVLNSSVESERAKLEFLKGFSSLNQTILWESDENIQGLPKNVFVRSSLPQSSILGHPNIRLFITHGHRGLLSTLEALDAGVPLLVLSSPGEYSPTVDQAVRTGYARRQITSDNVAEELFENIKDMISNDSYSKTAKRLSKLFHARPVYPDKLISHYVELAIETKGALHLRAPSQQYAWYQRWMLDQVIFLLLALVALAELLRIAVGTCLRVFTDKPNHGLKEKKS